MEINLPKLLEGLKEIEKNKTKYKSIPFFMGYYVCTIYISNAIMDALGKDRKLEQQIVDAEKFDNVFDKLTRALDEYKDKKLMNIDEIKDEDEVLLSAYGDLYVLTREYHSKYKSSNSLQEEYKDLLILHEMFGDKEYLDKAHELRKKMNDNLK